MRAQQVSTAVCCCRRCPPPLLYRPSDNHHRHQRTPSNRSHNHSCKLPRGQGLPLTPRTPISYRPIPYRINRDCATIQNGLCP
jgi:hypothetical protein